MKTTNKRGLELGKLSAVAQLAVERPTSAADAMIALDLIDAKPQVRKTFGDLKDLVASIRTHGIIEPVIVQLESDGRYRLIIGERRVRAARELGLEAVPAIIKRGLSELQIRSLQVAENNERENLTPYDEVMGVIEDVGRYGAAKARQIWNRGESWVSKRVGVKRYAAAVRALLQDGVCTDLEILHCLNQVHRLNKAAFEQLHRRLVSGHGVTREDARRAVAHLKDKKKAAAAGEETERSEHAGGPSEVVLDGEERAAAPAVTASTQRVRSQEQLGALMEDIQDGGQINRVVFKGLVETLATLGYDSAQTERALWRSFLVTVLPIFEEIGGARQGRFVDQLQAELREHTPSEMLAELGSEGAEGGPSNVRVNGDTHA